MKETDERRGLFPFRYYRSDTDVDGVPMPEDHYMAACGEMGLSKITVLLHDGKPYLHFPDHPHKFLCIARLTLSSLKGLPPSGFWRIGYRDGDVKNISIDNLFWRGDGPFGCDQSAQVHAYAQGVVDASRIVKVSKGHVESGIYLTAVNHVLEEHLKKTTE